MTAPVLCEQGIVGKCGVCVPGMMCGTVRAFLPALAICYMLTIDQSKNNVCIKGSVAQPSWAQRMFFARLAATRSSTSCSLVRLVQDMSASWTVARGASHQAQAMRGAATSLSAAHTAAPVLARGICRSPSWRKAETGPASAAPSLRQVSAYRMQQRRKQLATLTEFTLH